MPIMSEVILSPVISHEAKNATSEGIVIMAPIIEPLKNMPFVGLALGLSTV